MKFREAILRLEYDDALKRSQETDQQVRLKDKLQDLRTAMGGGAASAGH